jgi:hypothetical protein
MKRLFTLLFLVANYALDASSFSDPVSISSGDYWTENTAYVSFEVTQKANVAISSSHCKLQLYDQYSNVLSSSYLEKGTYVLRVEPYFATSSEYNSCSMALGFGSSDVSSCCNFSIISNYIQKPNSSSTESESSQPTTTVDESGSDFNSYENKTYSINLSLSKGWNLVSLQLDNVSSKELLNSSTQISTIWSYKDGAWKSASTEFAINASDGIWVKTAESTTINSISGQLSAFTNERISEASQSCEQEVIENENIIQDELEVSLTAISGFGGMPVTGGITDVEVVSKSYDGENITLTFKSSIVLAQYSDKQGTTLTNASFIDDTKVTFPYDYAMEIKVVSTTYNVAYYQIFVESTQPETSSNESVSDFSFSLPSASFCDSGTYSNGIECFISSWDSANNACTLPSIPIWAIKLIECGVSSDTFYNVETTYKGTTSGLSTCMKNKGFTSKLNYWVDIDDWVFYFNDSDYWFIGELGMPNPTIATRCVN